MLVGFCGVVIALRPSAASVTLPALIALTGSIIYALLMITTRMLRETDQTVLMTTQLLGDSAVRRPSMAPFGWVAPALPDLMLLVGIGAVLQVVSLFCVGALAHSSRTRAWWCRISTR